LCLRGTGNTRVHEQAGTDCGDLPQQRNLWSSAHDRVEVGHVALCAPQRLVERACQRHGVANRFDERRSHGRVGGPVAAACPYGAPSHEIQHRDHSHGRTRVAFVQ